MLNRLKISARLWLLTSTLGLLAVLWTMVGLHSLAQLNAAEHDLYTHRIVPLTQVTAIHERMLANRLSIANALLFPDEAAQSTAEVERRLAEIGVLWDSYTSAAQPPHEKALADRFFVNRKRYVEEGILPTLVFVRAGNADGARERAKNFTRPLFAVARDDIAALIAMHTDAARAELERSDESYAAQRNVAFVALALGLLVSLAFAASIIRSISTPIASMNAALARLAKGDFSATADVTAEDELAEMSASFNAALAYVRATVLKVREAASRLSRGDLSMRIGIDSNDELGLMAKDLDTAIEFMRTALTEVALAAEEVSEAAREMSAGSEELASGAQQQASSLEETSASLEQMTSSVKQTSDNAQEGAQASSKAREIATRGSQVASDAVRAMREVNESSARIADIITTIDEIAFQTNLLALNAAVEAARAGEMGRGFAVVAAEVRSLAVRSATSAKEIKGLIQDSLRKVEAGSALVDLSGAALVEIVTSVKRVTDIAGEIASASREQAGGIDQVNRAMGQMDSVTQESASQTEQLAATAESMAAQGEELLELVGRFTLTAGEAGRGRATKRKPAAAKSFAHGGGGHGNPRALLAGSSNGKGRSPAKASASNGSHAVQNDVANDDEGGFELF
jgi:methyl-accepting chemotaxis protein